MEYDRHHLHHVDGTDVWCETLTHCPSVCDCPVDECGASHRVTDMHALGLHWAGSLPRTDQRLLDTAAEVWALSTTAERQTLVVLLSREMSADPVLVVGALNR